MHTPKATPVIARVVAPTADEGAFLAAAWIAERARHAVFERGAFTVALAGGASPRALYSALRARDDIDWRAWEVFLGDERAVPESDPRSNLRELRAALLGHVPVPAAQVHPMFAPGLDADAMARAYEGTLRALLGEPAVLDLVILGLGKDARTLALYPGCAALTERVRDVVAVSAPPMSAPLDRITFTPPMVERARAVVLFAHGSGSGRNSPRNRFVAEALQQRGLATLLFDLLTADEERRDARTGHLRFDISMLAGRLVAATDWVTHETRTRSLRVGYFGASTGGGAALVAAAQRPDAVGAVVSRGGRPDLAGDALPQVRAPTLLIVGGDDAEVIALNREAMRSLRTHGRLEIVPGASHLFEEPGALERVAALAGQWFVDHLTSAPLDARKEE